MSTTALVTGGAGFFGQHLCRRLSDDGWAVRILDRAPEAAWMAPAGVRYARGDVCDPAEVQAALEGVDLIVHAAFAPPEQPIDVIRRVNVTGTRTVLAAARARGVGRVVLLSSTIVDRRLRAHPLLPRAPLSRLSAYRDSRVEAEAEAAHGGGDGMTVAMVRPKTFLGPGGVGAFALLFEAIRQGRAVPVLGRGDNRYQLIDMRDLADGITRLARSEATGCFGFGARGFGTVAQDLGALIAHAGTGARLRTVPAPLARIGLRAVELAGLTPLSEWHQCSARGQDSIVDIERAVTELGWRPARSNAEALADAYDWYASARTAGGSSPRPTHAPPPAHRILQRAGSSRLRPGRS